MNFNNNFTRSPNYIRFKRSINRPEALEYLLNLGLICQNERTIYLDFPDNFELAVSLGLPDELDPELVKQQLIKCGFMEELDREAGSYLITLFQDNNRSLISKWENGKKGGRGNINEANQQSN